MKLLMLEIEKLRAEMKVEMEKMRAEMNINMEKMRTETKTEMEKLRTEIERSKADIIKWTFIFWIGQIGVLSAIMFTMLKLFFR